MEIKLQDAELRVMDVVWNEGTVSAKRIYEALIDKLYDGSADRLVASILGKPDLPAEEIGRLRKLVEEWEE